MSQHSQLAVLLRKHRLAAGLSQEELAERSGISVRAISDLERGLRTAPRIESMRMLADGLGLTDADRASLMAAARPDMLGPAVSGDLEAHNPVVTRPPMPALRANPLPSPPTAIIGRVEEVTQITTLLAGSDVRLVTLTGPGGVGKTRLSLEAAHRIAPHFTGGVIFVDLSSVGDPSLVPASIAASVGLRDTGDRALTDVLVSYFSERECLLVIDNFEHLLEAAATLAVLVQHCPSLTLVVTSREPLRLRGEREVPVLPLAIPDASSAGDVDQISETAAVALFVERARDVRPAFELTVENAREVAEICRRLDGLPLAIELAAARVRLLSPAALLDRLGHRLGVLTEGARDAPDRQRTLRDTIAWSYDLLSPEEQTFFLRLSIFVNGFMLDGAEAVAAEPGRDSLDLLTLLVEKSLIQAAPFDGDSVRFKMLETVREFGLERLAEVVNEEEDARRKLFEYLLALAESFYAGSLRGWGSGEVGWYRRLDSELGNIRDALDWSLQQGEGELYLRLADSLGAYFTTRLITEEAVEIYRAGIDAASDAPLELRLIGMFLGGIFAGSLGRLDEARGWAESALAFTADESDPLLIGIAQSLAGNYWEAAGNCQRSAESLRAGLAALRQTQPTGWLYNALCELGDRLSACGDIDEAVALLDEAASGFALHSAKWGTAMVLQQRGHAALIQGDLEMARTCFDRSIDTAREVSDLRLELGAVLGLAAHALASGRPDDAARIVGAAERARESNGIGRALPNPIHNDRVISHIREQLGDQAFERCLAEGREIPYEQLVKSQV